ncbi:MAG: hypothetical protein GWN86_08160 [Desulfobacterales bacterium]|nr:hypothetical protein [Desulfobacterales bacterium]NIV68305.1 hypothetical protein [Candidatus Bathyarchaeota archaeon]
MNVSNAVKKLLSLSERAAKEDAKYVILLKSSERLSESAVKSLYQVAEDGKYGGVLAPCLAGGESEPERMRLVMRKIHSVLNMRDCCILNHAISDNINKGQTVLIPPLVWGTVDVIGGENEDRIRS